MSGKPPPATSSSVASVGSGTDDDVSPIADDAQRLPELVLAVLNIAFKPVVVVEPESELPPPVKPRGLGSSARVAPPQLATTVSISAVWRRNSSGAHVACSACS